MPTEYGRHEPDSWTWPDAYGDGLDGQEPPEGCPHCGGTGWQDCNGTVSMECPECGGDGVIGGGA
jgi:hypothetical protein